MSKRDSGGQQKRLIVRNASVKDVAGIKALVSKVYKLIPGYSSAMVRGHISQFPEGVFVALYDDIVVGYCATFRVGEAALKPHTWDDITGGGYASRHDVMGEYLYGMEVCVDPEMRGLRIGKRLYNRRKQLCEDLKLRGIVFGGRIPSYARRKKKYPDVLEYVRAVESKKINDPVLSFQLRNGFELIGVLKGYLSVDLESGGYGAHLLWRNPKIASDEETASLKRYGGRLPDTVRIATVQYQQRRVRSFDEFISLVEYFVNTVADYRADFVCFPELFTLQLLSIEDQELSPVESIEALTRYTEPFKTRLREMALKYNINIIGGSTPTRVASGRVENIAYIFLRDGAIHEQPKIHPTPNEVHWWNIEGGDTLQAIDTDCGPIGVLICYDSEFPELARHLIDQGVNIIFVPFCTDERQSYLRVRYCCQARAIENQCYMVMSGNCGNLPGVANMDIQYAQSSILTPCDFPFARDGIAADTTPNVETVALADLRIESLTVARNNGTVKNLKDRRHDLYSVVWREKE